MAQVIDYSVAPSDGDVLTYEAASGKYAPAAPAGGGSGVRVATVAFSRAQLLALHTTPVELVAAPAAGRMIWPLHYLCRVTAGATPYTVPGGTSFRVFAGDPATGDSPTGDLNASFLANTADFVQSAADFGSGLATAARSGLALSADLSGAVTDGDGTLDVTVAYIVV